MSSLLAGSGPDRFAWRDDATAMQSTFTKVLPMFKRVRKNDPALVLDPDAARLLAALRSAVGRQGAVEEAIVLHRLIGGDLAEGLRSGRWILAKNPFAATFDPASLDEHRRPGDRLVTLVVPEGGRVLLTDPEAEIQDAEVMLEDRLLIRVSEVTPDRVVAHVQATARCSDEALQTLRLFVQVGKPWPRVADGRPGSQDEEALQLDEVRSARVRAAMVGTAVGDALGDPTEFVTSLEDLAGFDGAGGIRSLRGAPPQFTDDTQMTLFTAEALLVAIEQDGVDPDSDSARGVLARRALEAQLRWRATQKRSALASYGEEPWGGSLREREVMHRVKAPGQTCLSALDKRHAGFSPGAPMRHATNDSKGCGGVMRAAPYGFVLSDPWWPACDGARLTHGHTLGWATAGLYAVLVRDLLGRGPDATVFQTTRGAVSPLMTRMTEVGDDGHLLGELEQLMSRTIDDAEERRTQPPGALVQAIPEWLGEGWVAEEALAIGLWCALAFDDPTDALAASATHRGDTDSTAAITGCLLGLIHGSVDVFDVYEPGRIEGMEIIHEVSDRLIAVRRRAEAALVASTDEPPPIDRSWWIEPGRVLGGAFAGDRTEEGARVRLGALLDAGVRLFVNLQEAGELGRGGVPFNDYQPLVNQLARERSIRGVGFVRVPIPDMGTPDHAGELRTALDTIDHVVEAGNVAYVHCWGGHGRTGTLAGCLLRRRGMTAEQAFEQIAAARSHDAYLAKFPSPQTEEQRSFVEHWRELEGAVAAQEVTRVDEPRWAASESVFRIGSRPDDPVVRRGLRVMHMVQHLHAAGYQRLRVCAYDRLGEWRLEVGPADLFTRVAWRPDDSPLDDEDVLATYTSADENRYFGFDDAGSDTAADLARRFLDRFPRLAERGRGIDLPYAGWFTLLVGSVADHGLPEFLANRDDVSCPVPSPPPVRGR